MVMPRRCFRSSWSCIIEREYSSISSNDSLSLHPGGKFHRMSALPSSFVSIGDTQTPFFSGSVSMQVGQCLSSRNLIISTTYPGKAKPLKLGRSFTVQASRDTGRPSTASIFISGFVLGGTVVGTLGCIFAPQISKALAGADRKDLMRKLPKFIYDEEKALEKTRKILTEKIAQLNSAIDDVSAQLHAGDDDDGAPNGVAVNPDELEASI